VDCTRAGKGVGPDSETDLQGERREEGECWLWLQAHLGEKSQKDKDGCDYGKMPQPEDKIYQDKGKDAWIQALGDIGLLEVHCVYR